MEMNKRIQELKEEIKSLQEELAREIEKKEKILSYEIREKVVLFKEEVAAFHRTRVTPVFTYLRQARLRNILTAPLIYACLFPALFMDLVVSLYQWICFPVYGIPRVKRRKYLVLDRHYLKYLNVIEKINCYYCGYFNGLIAYVREVASRTEQYWCPIKHARSVPHPHSRYRHFADYGDSDAYHGNKQQLRHHLSKAERAGDKA